MAKINGVKSVDFKVTASGEGVVNWNGSFSLMNSQAGKFVNNHTLPKMRGVDPMRLSSLNSKQLDNAKLFISQNCVRNAIFKNETINLQTVDSSNVDRVLCSILGLVRGYVIADKVTKLSLKRKSAFLLEDFVDNSTIIRYEQFSNSGERNETSIFSKSNVDSTKYEAYGSISIEDLQFIVLEDSFGRSSYSDILSIEQGKNIEECMNKFLSTLTVDKNKNPKAMFHHNYVRVGGITNHGEAGLLLNDDAIELVVDEILNRLKDLFVRQSKGYFVIDSLLVDYNDGQPMRIKRDEAAINSNVKPFAVYYKYEDLAEKEYVEKMNLLKKEKDEQKKKKSAEDKKRSETKKTSTDVEQSE